MRAILAVPAVLLVPGYAWVLALRRWTSWAPKAADAIAFGVALSFAGVAFGGIALSALSIPLTTTSWALLVAALTTPALAAVLAPVRARPSVLTAWSRDRPRVGVAVLAAGLVVAAALAAAVIVSLRSDAIDRVPTTELGLRRTTGAAGERLLAVDVRNGEGRAITYTLRLRSAAGEISRAERRLPAGAAWVQLLDLAAVRPGGLAISARLFRADRPRLPYREVRIAPGS